MSHVQAKPPTDLSPVPFSVGDTPARVSRFGLRKALMAGAGLLILAAGAWYGNEYWTTGRFQVATDDAYVQADNTTIAPKVSGYLSEVLVGDNQPIKAGQVLARIDPRDFRVALAQARSDVAAARATIANKQAALAAQETVIDGARATIAVDQAQETFAREDNRRYAVLASDGWGTVQKAQEAASRIAAVQATVTRDTAALANATRHVDVLNAELAQAEAALDHAQAVQDQAELNLSYTTIVAPNDGVVGNRTLRVGQYVQAGTQLMSVVPAGSTYIVANYKETQLTHVRAGQPVSISIDTYPDQVFHGHVDSLSPASGQEFALLPPDNATGNFTKVVQRIPVKILLDQGGPVNVVLRPGMSVYPSIDTKTHTNG
ncbi:MAG TPA: HlyD family secretion protein [Rhodopila sp.]|nr:HlyD family secretion protein [Rhodopila sp.]